MAKKKARKVARRVARKNPMRVVSLSTALKMVKKAKANPCGGRANPLRHFPKLAGRGRPAKIKTWEMTTVLANGRVAQRTNLKATKEQAFAKAAYIRDRKYHGQAVREVILDDGK